MSRRTKNEALCRNCIEANVLEKKEITCSNMDSLQGDNPVAVSMVFQETPCEKNQKQCPFKCKNSFARTFLNSLRDRINSVRIVPCKTEIRGFYPRKNITPGRPKKRVAVEKQGRFIGHVPVRF